MPFQNRVTPLGELVATPERGLVYGNRGRLHDEQGVGSVLLRWSPGGYSARRSRFSGRVDSVTPPIGLRVLASGWRGSLPLMKR
jgi:hypothetical protein